MPPIGAMQPAPKPVGFKGPKTQDDDYSGQDDFYNEHPGGIYVPPDPGPDPNAPSPKMPGPNPNAPTLPTLNDTVEEPAPAPPDASRWAPSYGGPGGPEWAASKAIQDKILELINQGPVDPNSEDIKNVVNAARVTERRQGDRTRQMLAERRAAQGLSGGGGFETDLLGIEQGIGERLGSLNAGLVREAQMTRRNEIMAALQLGQGRISAEEQNALQRELANLNAQLSREQMALQNEQFEAGLSMDALIRLIEELR